MFVFNLIDPRHHNKRDPQSPIKKSKKSIFIFRFSNERQEVYHLAAFTLTQLFLAWMALLVGMLMGGLAFAGERG